MNPTKKFWYDENSEPPKNYIWVKNDKQYEFSVSERRWKEISSSEESGSSSKEITIDDVVKFIHDDIEETMPGMFPYTTWDEIPDYNSAKNGSLCKTNNISAQMLNLVLNLPNYKIGNKLTDK